MHDATKSNILLLWDILYDLKAFARVIEIIVKKPMNPMTPHSISIFRYPFSVP